MAICDPPSPPEVPELPDTSIMIDVPTVPESPSISESLPVSQVSDSLEIAADRILEAAEKLNNAVYTQTVEVMEYIGQALQEISQTIVSSMLESASKLIDALKKYKFPTISDEEAAQLVESNRIWGQYGWTHIPSMPIGMFDTPPEDVQAANKAAMQYCTASEMNWLLDKLQKGRQNKKDLEAAIFCYQNKQYKACALLLCGLIDSKLIRLQTGEHRPVGERAVKRLKLEYDESGEKYLVEALHTYNLLAYLETLFAKAKGFENEPETLNRNFIDHGMNRRMVRKRDCIQLFLALYNLTQFLERGLTEKR